MHAAPRASHAWSFIAAVPIALAALSGTPAVAHCDTLDGPVVASARIALEKGDVTPVLRWVSPDAEAEIRSAFAKATKVRAAGPEARELSDRFFFETLVRVHRAGEGAPYDGLKPSGSQLDPAVNAADRALGTGDVGGLAKLVTDHVDAEIRERWTRVIEAKKHADENVSAGRAYVAAYVDFIHYVERVHNASAGGIIIRRHRRPRTSTCTHTER